MSAQTEKCLFAFVPELEKHKPLIINKCNYLAGVNNMSTDECDSKVRVNKTSHF